MKEVASNVKVISDYVGLSEKEIEPILIIV